jgi:hypothetical protein
VTSAAVASLAGSPGVTTLVCAIAAGSTEDRPLLVVEAATSGRHRRPLAA